MIWLLVIIYILLLPFIYYTGFMHGKNEVTRVWIEDMEKRLNLYKEEPDA
jgi:hypothetical protein